MCSVVNMRQALKVTGCVYYWSVSRLMGSREERAETKAHRYGSERKPWAISSVILALLVLTALRTTLVHAELYSAATIFLFRFVGMKVMKENKQIVWLLHSSPDWEGAVMFVFKLYLYNSAGSNKVLLSNESAPLHMHKYFLQPDPPVTTLQRSAALRWCFIPAPSICAHVAASTWTLVKLITELMG